MDQAKEEDCGPSKSKKLRLTTDEDLSDIKEKPSTSLSDSAEDNNKRARESSHLKNSHSNTSNAVLVAKHYNSVVNTNVYIRSESCILYMRNFNNWIKSILLLEYNNSRSKRFRMHVLDLCCGKGGDLYKWRTLNIAHLVCTDVAEISLQHCQDRYNHLLNRYDQIFTAEFILADCTKVRLKEKYKDPSTSLDMVSCQFAFHYCFESLPQAECMLRNASECLKSGGYFVGTIPDAYSLVSRWQRCNGNSFGNNIYNVEFFCDKTNPPLFGAKYHFRLEDIVNCPEYLVYLPVFRKLALKFGLELVLFERFDRFYECRKNSYKSILSKMNTLETFPPRPGKTLNGKAENDYEHAKKYMRNSSARQIGTLSQSEWEIISLYAVFVFQKVKSVE